MDEDERDKKKDGKKVSHESLDHKQYIQFIFYEKVLHFKDCEGLILIFENIFTSSQESSIRNGNLLYSGSAVHIWRRLVVDLPSTIYKLFHLIYWPITPYFDRILAIVAAIYSRNLMNFFLSRNREKKNKIKWLIRLYILEEMG